MHVEIARALPFAEPNSVIAEAKQEQTLLVQGKAYLCLLAPVIRCWPSEVTVRSAVSAMTNSYLVCSQLATLSGLQVSRLSLEPAWLCNFKLSKPEQSPGRAGRALVDDRRSWPSDYQVPPILHDIVKTLQAALVQLLWEQNFTNGDVEQIKPQMQIEG